MLPDFSTMTGVRLASTEDVDVVAGIDLTKMQDGDVTIDEKSHRAQLTLPPPELLSVRIDNDRTYVHSRKTDFFAQQQIELETRARQAAARRQAPPPRAR